VRGDRHRQESPVEATVRIGNSATGRIWPLMVTHAAFDLAALAMIYWNLESDVAHLIFK
jgi:hypothetical protein